MSVYSNWVGYNVYPRSGSLVCWHRNTARIWTSIVDLTTNVVYRFKVLKNDVKHVDPRVLSPFRGGGIAYLNDPDSYADWSFYTPVRATQSDRLKGRGQTR